VVRGALHVHSLEGMSYSQYLQSRWAVRQASITVNKTTVLAQGAEFMERNGDRDFMGNPVFASASDSDNNWYVVSGGMSHVRRPDGTDAIIVVMQQKLFAAITRDKPIYDATFASLHGSHKLKASLVRSTQLCAAGAHLFCKKVSKYGEEPINMCTEGRAVGDEQACTCALDASALKKRKLTCRVCGCDLMPSTTNPHLLRIQLHVPYDADDATGDAIGFVVLHSTTFRVDSTLSVVSSDTVVADAAMTHSVLKLISDIVIFNGMRVVMLADTPTATRMLNFSIGDNRTQFSYTELPNPWPLAEDTLGSASFDSVSAIINPIGFDCLAFIVKRTAHDLSNDNYTQYVQVMTHDGQILRTLSSSLSKYTEDVDIVSHSQCKSVFAVKCSESQALSVYSICGVGDQPLSVMDEYADSVAMLGNGHVVTADWFRIQSWDPLVRRAPGAAGTTQYVFQLIHTLDMRDLVAPDSDYAVKVATYVDILGSTIQAEERPTNYLSDVETNALDDLYDWFGGSVGCGWLFYVTQDSKLLCIAVDKGFATLDPDTFEIVCNYDVFEDSWGGPRFQDLRPYNNELLFKCK
jgi:hypothetical protein